MLSKFAAFLAVSLVVLSPLGVRAATTHVAATPITVAVYAGMLHRINPQMPSWQSHNLASHLLRNAAHWRIDPNLLAALVTVESRWHTYARSRTGAIGLGQLMPGTAAGLHVNPHDPIQNLFGSARYLSGLIDRYRGKPDQFRLACAAYNAGPHAVARFGGIPPYAETQRYVVNAHQHTARTRVVRSFDIACLIADHHARCRRNADHMRRVKDEFRLRFATVAIILRCVRADEKPRKRTEQRFDARIDRLDIGKRDQPSPDAALVAHDRDRDTGRTQRIERIERAG